MSKHKFEITDRIPEDFSRPTKSEKPGLIHRKGVQFAAGIAAVLAVTGGIVTGAEAISASQARSTARYERGVTDAVHADGFLGVDFSSYEDRDYVDIEVDPHCTLDSVEINYTKLPDGTHDITKYSFDALVHPLGETKRDNNSDQDKQYLSGGDVEFNFTSAADLQQLLGGQACTELAKQLQFQGTYGSL